MPQLCMAFPVHQFLIKFTRPLFSLSVVFLGRDVLHIYCYKKFTTSLLIDVCSPTGGVGRCSRNERTAGEEGPIQRRQ